jgi:hypothetical protein
MARITFDPDEVQALRASAREQAVGDPLIAYQLERAAAEGIDLEQCIPYEDIQARYGLGGPDAAHAQPGAA